MSLHILVAEDNPVSKQLIEKILQGQGHTVVSVNNGEEAIARPDLKQFNVILADINMGQMNGFELVQQLRQQSIYTPVIAITGEASSDIQMRANDVGIQDILQKPVLPDRLIYTVEQAHKKTENFSFDDNTFDAEALMLKTLELAVKSASSGAGRAFGALIATKDGEVLATGHSDNSNQKDPFGFAEAVAIKQACEKLGRLDLSDCVLFSSFEPTLFGKALITQVNIAQVYFSLSSRDLAPSHGGATTSAAPETAFTQICTDRAKRIFSLS